MKPARATVYIWVEAATVPIALLRFRLTEANAPASSMLPRSCARGHSRLDDFVLESSARSILCELDFESREDAAVGAHWTTRSTRSPSDEETFGRWRATCTER